MKVKFAEKAGELERLHAQNPHYRAMDGRELDFLLDFMDRNQYYDLVEKFERRYGQDEGSERLFTRYAGDIESGYVERLREDMETAARFDQVKIFELEKMNYFDGAMPNEFAEAFNMALRNLHVQFIMKVLDFLPKSNFMKTRWVQYYADDWTRKVLEASTEVAKNPNNKSSWRNFLKALTRRLNREENN